MGTFYTKCIIENHINRKKAASVPKILVDTGSEYTWISNKILHKMNVTREKKDLVFIIPDYALSLLFENKRST